MQHVRYSRDFLHYISVSSITSPALTALYSLNCGDNSDAAENIAQMRGIKMPKAPTYAFN
jgi:hypothetical protein